MLRSVLGLIFRQAIVVALMSSLAFGLGVLVLAVSPDDTPGALCSVGRLALVVGVGVLLVWEVVQLGVQVDRRAALLAEAGRPVPGRPERLLFGPLPFLGCAAVLGGLFVMRFLWTAGTAPTLFEFIFAVFTCQAILYLVVGGWVRFRFWGACRGLVEGSSAKLVEPWTTIISARGTVGKLAISAQPMTFNQSCYGIRSSDGHGEIYAHFALRNLVEDLQRAAHGSVFDTITRKTFKSATMVIPPVSRAHEFCNSARPLLQRVLVNGRESRTLAELRDTLLPKLISGEIRVHEAEDIVDDLPDVGPPRDAPLLAAEDAL